MAGSIDRRMVKEFFDWQWPIRQVAMAQWGWGLVIVGIFTLSVGIGLLLLPAGGVLLYLYYRKVDLASTPIGRNVTEVERAKRNDLTKIWHRSFVKIDRPLADLREFDLRDYQPLGEMMSFEGLTRSHATLEQIASRSVFLFGPAENARLQISTGENFIEYNPVNAAVLYVAGNQLVVYHAISDLTTGDLSSETVQRIYLKEIVQVSVRTSSTRIQYATDEGFLKKFNNLRSSAKETTELVRSETVVYLTKTDGGTLDFPVGTPSVRDGAKGELDTDEIAENREMRIATALQQNIEAAKRAATV